MMDLYAHIRDIPDFPKPGILFKDITPLLKSPEAMMAVEEGFLKAFAGEGITAVAGIESRGFIFGIALARRLGVAFLPVRKAGKLPAATISHSYELEYGEDTIQIHEDAADKWDRVLIVDDLLATGGTAEATAALISKLGAEIVGLAFVIELSFLNGRARLAPHRVESLLTYTGE